MDCMDEFEGSEEEFREFLLDEAKKWVGKLRLDASAEDVTQEVWLKLWEKRGTLTCPEALGAVTVKNHCLDLKRKPIHEVVELDENTTDGEQPLEAVDRQTWLNKCLKSYSWEEQKAIRLRIQGLTYKEISKATGVSTGRAHTLVESVADKLAREWNE